MTHTGCPAFLSHCSHRGATAPCTHPEVPCSRQRPDPILPAEPPHGFHPCFFLSASAQTTRGPLPMFRPAPPPSGRCAPQIPSPPAHKPQVPDPCRPPDPPAPQAAAALSCARSRKRAPQSPAAPVPQIQKNLLFLRFCFSSSHSPQVQTHYKISGRATGASSICIATKIPVLRVSAISLYYSRNPGKRGFYRTFTAPGIFQIIRRASQPHAPSASHRRCEAAAPFRRIGH